MVGLANRSGRCVTCTRRKIKCDVRLPSCSRCERLGLQCEYPNSKHGEVFINRSVKKPFVKALDVLSETGKRRSLKAKEETSPKNVQPAEQGDYQNSTLSMPKPLKSDDLNRMQLIAVFMDLYLPKTNDIQWPSCQSPATWVGILPHVSISNSAYNRSIAALCVSQFGALNRDTALMMESRRLYGSALDALRIAISSPKLVAPEATLASIVVLSTYEIFTASNSSNGWVSHVRGGSLIAQMLRPGTLDSHVGKQLVGRIKTIATFESIRNRNTSLLKGLYCYGYTPEAGSRSDLYCRLVDILIQIPTILERLDTVALEVENKLTETTVLQDLFLLCSNLREELFEWYEDLRKLVYPAYWTVASMAHNPADDTTHGRVFPIVFHFPNLDVAQVHMIYWSTLINLYRSMMEIDEKLRMNDIPPASDSGNTVESNGHYQPNICPSQADMVDLAKKICQSFEYCYRTENGTLGPQSTAFPRWAAWSVFDSNPNCSREKQWCDEVTNMTSPGARFDLRVMHFARASCDRPLPMA